MTFSSITEFVSSMNQVYTETLNSRNIKVENPSKNDILGFVNDEITLRRIEKKISKYLLLSYFYLKMRVLFWESRNPLYLIQNA